jgi:hypothetical protein
LFIGLCAGAGGSPKQAKKPLKRMVKRKAILSSDDEGEAAAPMEDSSGESGSEFVPDKASSKSDSDDSVDAAASEEVLAALSAVHSCCKKIGLLIEWSSWHGSHQSLNFTCALLRFETHHVYLDRICLSAVHFNPENFNDTVPPTCAG